MDSYQEQEAHAEKLMNNLIKNINFLDKSAFERIIGYYRELPIVQP